MHGGGHFTTNEIINLKENTCPNREDRAGFGIKTYFGKASKLVEEAKKGHIENVERAFEQTGGCVLMFTALRLYSIRNAVVISHAPVGCSLLGSGYRESMQHLPPFLDRPPQWDLHWMTTNLSDSDIIFGGTGKLADAIKEANRRYSPQAIIITTSCASGIIGDDIEGTVSSVQPEVKAKIVPVHCEGHRSSIVQTGYDAMWHSFLKYLIKKPEKKQEDLVNVVNMFSYTWLDCLEAKRLLGKMGLRANLVPDFAAVEDIEVMSEAALTASFCPTFGDYVMKGLEQEYGVPYFRTPSPLGFKNTDAWLRKIGEFTGREKEAKKVIEEEHARWAPQVKTLKEAIKKLKSDGSIPSVIGALGQGRMLTHTTFFKELGLDIAASLTLDFDGLFVEELEELIEDVGDFDVCVNTFQGADQTNLVQRKDPDIYLTCPFKGGAYKRGKGVGWIHTLRPMIHPMFSQVFYSGAISFAEMAIRTFKNRSFQKTLFDKTEDVYSEWWYKHPLPYLSLGEVID